MKDTDTDFKVIKRIMKGDLVRFDILVLARFCDYLNCTLNDIIEYVEENLENEIDYSKLSRNYGN